VNRRCQALVLTLALAAAAASAGAMAWARRASTLLVEDVGRARILHREPVAPGDLFVLDYVHSSERVPVRGTFRVGADGSLTVTETAFAGFGPGLPELSPGDDWRFEGGRIVHRSRPDAATALTEFRLRVSPVARQRLTTPAGQVLDLGALAGAGSPIRVLVR
jgi:hypothetical protein